MPVAGCAQNPLPRKNAAKSGPAARRGAGLILNGRPSCSEKPSMPRICSGASANGPGSGGTSPASTAFSGHCGRSQGWGSSARPAVSSKSAASREPSEMGASSSRLSARRRSGAGSRSGKRTAPSSISEGPLASETPMRRAMSTSWRSASGSGAVFRHSAACRSANSPRSGRATRTSGAAAAAATGSPSFPGLAMPAGSSCCLAASNSAYAPPYSARIHGALSRPMPWWCAIVPPARTVASRPACQAA